MFGGTAERVPTAIVRLFTVLFPEMTPTMSDIRIDTDNPAGFRWLNKAPSQELEPRIRACLAVERWVTSLVGSRPYPDIDSLLLFAGKAASGLTDDEVLEAIEDHPRIGMLADQGSATAVWSATEQAGVDRADTAVLTALGRQNRDYERRFGHIYLVCATGMDGGRILADLRNRMTNDPSTELAVIRRELAEIAELRLRKVIAETPPTSTEKT